MNDQEFKIELENLTKTLQSGSLDKAEVDSLNLDKRFHSNHTIKNILGIIFLRKKNYTKADFYFKQSIDINPNFYEAYYNLGLLNSLIGNENLDLSIKYLKQAIKLNPQYIEANFNLGNILQKNKKFKDSIEFFNKAISLRKDFLKAHYNLGLSYLNLSDFDQAEKNFMKTIKINPYYFLAYNALGILNFNLKNFDKSSKYFEQAISIQPNYIDSLINLGNVLTSQKKFNKAESCFQKAINLQPNFSKTYLNYGNLFFEQSNQLEAIKKYKLAIKFNPKYFLAHNNLGVAFGNLQQYDQAISCYNKALELNPQYTKALSNLLFETTYMTENNIETYLTRSKSFKNSLPPISANEILPYQFDLDSKKLRVGFVSSDLGRHPGGFFLLNTIRNLKGKNLELYAYSNFDRSDEIADEFRSLFDTWHSIEFKNDLEVINQIRKDGIHILIDCMGHTKDNRLTIFPYKPAPIQLTYLAPGSTGIPEIDYFLGSSHLIPKHEENHFVEKIWRLPEVLQCFTPPNFDLEVKELPALKNGYITFGSLNKYTKINDQVIKLWSKILNSNTNSKIIIKCNEFTNIEVKKSFLKKFNENNVSSKIIDLNTEMEERQDLLKLFNSIDICLDTFPFQGNTTTCEAAWMGVPTLTLKGDRFLFHFGESINTNLGLNEWIADDQDDFVKKSNKFSTNLQYLSQLRKELRNQLLKSPVCDSPRLADHFNKMLWHMWENHNKNN